MFQSRQQRQWVLWGAAVAVAVFATLVVLLRLGDRGVSSGSEYSIKELGVPGLVSAYVVKSQSPWIDSRVGDGAETAGHDSVADFLELRGHRRERAWFERQAAAALNDAVEDLDGDLDWYRGVLAQEWYEAVDACARDNGYAGGYSDFSDIPTGIGEDWPRHDQSTLKDRDQCAADAASYPGLDVEVRDDLLRRTRQRLQSAVEAWIRGNPSVAVPVEWHPGAPQPFADSLDEICRLSSDPAQCARDAGVAAPAE